VDSIAATWALLGPIFALVRPLVALLTGLGGGALVHWFGEREAPAQTENLPAKNHCRESCCADQQQRGPLWRAIRYGLVVLPRDIGGALVLGVLIAGLIAALVPQGALEPYLGGGMLAILLLMATGVPIYVCATGAVPIAAGFIHLGASPGAALAFLISGPATNAATITTVWKVLGRRTAIVYLLTVALVAFGSGLLLDRLDSTVRGSVPSLGECEHEVGGMSLGTHVWATVLLVVFAFAYGAGRWNRPSLAQPAPAVPSSPTLPAAELDEWVEQVELAVSGMTCEHCAARVRRALAGCAGVRAATVTLHPGRAMVVGRGLDKSRLLAAVAEAGYEARRQPLPGT
jgi:copper chaperone CopZ